MRYRKGDKVTPDPDGIGVPAETLGRVFTVQKVNPKNLKCSADDGGRGINFPPHLLLPATDDNVAKALAHGERPFTPTEHFVLGEVVTLKSAWKNWSTETPLVVVGGRDRVNVTPVGGDGDRYLRVQPGMLVRRVAHVELELSS